jgi:hypothetical protein
LRCGRCVPAAAVVSVMSSASMQDLGANAIPCPCCFCFLCVHEQLSQPQWQLSQLRHRRSDRQTRTDSTAPQRAAGRESIARNSGNGRQVTGLLSSPSWQQPPCPTGFWNGSADSQRHSESDTTARPPCCCSSSSLPPRLPRVQVFCMQCFPCLTRLRQGCRLPWASLARQPCPAAV